MPCPRIIGFLFGFAAAASYSATHLLQEYKQASETLQSAVDELQRNTEKVRHTIHALKMMDHLL
jgi:chaperonin cofactor prefoldin